MCNFIQAVIVVIFLAFQVSEASFNFGNAIYLANQDDEKFETDIILNIKQQQSIFGNSSEALTSIESEVWPDGIIYYEFDTSIQNDQSAIDLINEAIQHWESNTCLVFTPRTSEVDYVKFFGWNGCWAYVGKQGGMQPVSIGHQSSQCRNIGNVNHEIGHAVGFWHEQSRPDRDDYITILWDNIISGKSFNFGKYSSNMIDSLNTSYDYYSLMHYSQYAFTANGQPTIQAIDSSLNIVLGEQEYLSATDIKQIKSLYNCNETNDIESQSNDHDTFVLYNRVTGKCVAIQEFKRGYSMSTLVNSEWEVVLVDCNVQNKMQQWMWNEMNHLVHVNTGMCLSAKDGNNIVLKRCSGFNWSLRWFCSGDRIVQSRIQHCLTPKISSEDVKMKMLEKATSDIKLSLFNAHFNSNIQLKLMPCSVKNVYQKFAIYGQKGNQESFCSTVPSHKASSCYSENTMDEDGWIRCLRRGYYATSLKHYPAISSIGIECCSKLYTPGIIEYPQVTCYHRIWWSGNAITKFRCNNGEYLNGIQHKAGRVMLIECCQVAKTYHRCQNIYTNDGCKRKGYIAEYYFNKNTCFYKECKQQIKCCI
jgi:hypothetical protein